MSEAPFWSGWLEVEPGWIDYNGHLNMGYYTVLFDLACDDVWPALGFGPDYIAERGFTSESLDAALETAEAQDLEAAAFAVAREKAERVTGLAAESAFRRVVGHVLRRGYPDGLARKVAREAVFATREDERSAER